MSSRATDTTPSLLPAGSTTLERDLEQVTARIADVPVPFDTLWNADTCPANLLGWLAWATSVDEWDPTWPDNIKRDAIRLAPLLHQRKGTVWALQNALVQFGVGTQVKEWWAMSPVGPAGTFDLVTEVTPTNSALLTPEFNTQIKRVITNMKPVSRTFGMRMQMAMPSQAKGASVGGAVEAAFTEGLAVLGQTTPTLVLDFCDDTQPTLALDFVCNSFEIFEPESTGEQLGLYLILE